MSFSHLFACQFSWRDYLHAALETPSRKTEAAKGQRRGSVLEVLRALLADGHSDAVLELVEKLVARNAELERLLGQVRAQGKKNEGVSSQQLLLMLDGLGPEALKGLDDANKKLREASGIDEKREEEEAPAPKKQPSLRRPLPANLRRILNPIRVPDAERPCPECGGERTCIGHDDTEVLDLIPAEAVVRVDQREKLACLKCEGELVRAPMGDKVVPAGRMGTRAVAELLVDKYLDGLPLNRQKQRWERRGVSLSISTLADQVTWATDLLRPLWRAALTEVLAAIIMHLDGTSLPVLDKSEAGGIRIGSLWGYVGDNNGELTALYLYASTGKKTGQREGELGPEDMLARRVGRTVADASSLFDASFKRDDLIECGCNMHARRYFTKALDAGDARASLPLAAYKKIYEIEEEIRQRDSDGKRAERQARSKPVFEELVSWSRKHQPHEPPSSALGRAIGYLLNNEIALKRFLDDGSIPIDNGVVERLHVRTALTRKNYLFAGSDAGAERAAIAYTIIGCCALAEVNPVEYLADMLPRLARGIRLVDAKQLLPARWKAARAAAAAQASAPAQS